MAFKNNAPFINCISKINGVQIDNAEDSDVEMPMYNLLEYSKNYKKQKNDYTTGNLLDFAYFKENYRLIAIDLSKQSKSKDPRQINFIGKIEGKNNGVTKFFIIEK